MSTRRKASALFGSLWFVLLPAVLILLALVVFSHVKQPETGLRHGRLLPCPVSPNCVCSEEGEDTTHSIEPFPLAEGEDEMLAWRRFIEMLQEAGGVVDVRTQSDIYVHARFTTPWLRFVDDVEARLDMRARVIHLRSASRVGYSDFGVNRARIERLRRLYAS